jgi:hypothetical protein
MAQWKKVIVSGSRAHLVDATASISLTTANAIGFLGTASNALSSSYAVTASYALNVSSPTFAISGSTGNAPFSAAGDTLLLTGSNGLVVTVTDNSNITTASFGFPTNAQIDLSTGGVTGSFTGSFVGNITSATSASSVLVVTDNTSATRYLTFVDSDNVAPGAYEALSTDAGITYNPGTDTLTISGDLAVNGPTSADITTTTTTTATVFNTNATTVNIGGAATAVSIGAGTGNTTVNNSLVVTGDLTVNGTTTTINTNNLLVEDRFILLASGSTAATDGGIIVQSNVAGTGFAFAYDDTTNRWYYQNALAGSATTLGAIVYTTTAASVMVQRDVNANRPNDATGPLYGGTNGWGNMWIDSNVDNDIWIYV